MTNVAERAGADDADTRFIIRRLGQPGDLGWVVMAHGELYAAEYGWDRGFEAYVARIVADYLADTDPRRTAGWVAELDGVPAGFVCCVPEDDTTARLRLLLVERWARGLGIGGRLVDEVLLFARQAGYERIVLSTYSVLADARRIYQRAGFTLVHEEPEHSYGHDLTAQDWARSLHG